MAIEAINESRFVTTLRQSQLLSDEEIDPFVANLSVANDQAIAREFLKAQLLTPFQAKYVLHGRWRGLVIGDYRIIEPLSVGGMGEVYLARHKEAEESVAIKILRSELREVPKNIQRFRLEAFSVMTLKHPNLLQGIEYGTIEQAKKETHYLITEFVRGPNLYELTVIRRQLPWQQACDLIAQAARGLQAAHDHHFVHRDIKPGNIIISSSGVAKVVDFGLAQYKGPNESFSFSLKKRRGTQRYAAPEQTVMDEPIDPRADIYSLGCTMFFALCGRPPSENATNLFPRSRVAIDRLLKIREDLPEELVAVLRRMLRRIPDQRIESAIAVAEALEPFAKRMSVDINFPALLRARDKARRSQSSINTDGKMGIGTTLQGESKPSESDESQEMGFDIADDVDVHEPEAGSASQANVSRFVAIYRRHRQHVDRLRQRVEELETELQGSRDRESELTTLLNVKSIEQEQLVAEHRQQTNVLNKKQEESHSNKELLAAKDQEIDDLAEMVSSLESGLEDADQQKHSLEQYYLDLQEKQQRKHQRALESLNSKLKSLESMYHQERARRQRASEVVDRWRGQVKEEQRQQEELQKEIEALQSTAVNEQQQRDQLHQKLADAKQMSERFSSEILTIFNQISTDQMQDTFFDSYEKACELDSLSSDEIEIEAESPSID